MTDWTDGNQMSMGYDYLFPLCKTSMRTPNDKLTDITIFS